MMYLRQHNTRIAGRRRAAATIVEVTISMLLLTIMLIAVAQAMAQVVKQRRAVQRRLLATDVVANHMERAAALPWEELTAERMEAWRLASDVTDRLPDSKLTFHVDATGENPTAKRVIVELQWSNSAGDMVEPARLVTWRHRGHAKERSP